MTTLGLLAGVACCLMFAGVTLVIAKYDRDRNDDLMIPWILLGGMFWLIGFLAAISGGIE